MLQTDLVIYPLPHMQLYSLLGKGNKEESGTHLGVIGGERERRSNAPDTLIVVDLVRTNRQQKYTALVTLCKGFGTKTEIVF